MILDMIRRSVAVPSMALLIVVGAACVAAPSPPGSSPAASPTPLASPSPVAAPSDAAASASIALGPHDASQAARDLLDATASDVEMSVRREKEGAGPLEILITSAGRIEPAIGRGRMLFDFRGMFVIPGASEPPDPASIVAVVWTPAEVFARPATQPPEAWESRSRADARTSGGYAGRLPDEILGLVTLVAASPSKEFVGLEDAPIGGTVAQRWRVPVPVDVAVAEGVPAEVPNASVLRETYGIDTLDVEVWLVDGTLRRVAYQLARDEAPYGGPDRTTVTYDWSAAAGTDSIVVPPAP